MTLENQFGTMITGGKIIDNVNTPYSVGYINLLGLQYLYQLQWSWLV